MNLDNTSHPSIKYCADKVNAKYIHGRPESELIPSRYALRVCEIDVMVISDGVLSLPGAMLGHNVDPSVRAAWLEDKFPPPFTWLQQTATHFAANHRTRRISDGNDQSRRNPPLHHQRSGKGTRRHSPAHLGDKVA